MSLCCLAGPFEHGHTHTDSDRPERVADIGASRPPCPARRTSPTRPRTPSNTQCCRLNIKSSICEHWRDTRCLSCLRWRRLQTGLTPGCVARGLSRCGPVESRRRSRVRRSRSRKGAHGGTPSIAGRRVGKTIVMSLGQGSLNSRNFSYTSGMTGRLLVSSAEVPRRSIHTRSLRLADGREVRVVDPAAVRAVKREENGRRRQICGAWPRAADGMAPGFRGLFRGRKVPIKAALLNQSLLHGVRKHLRGEALARAGVRPRHRRHPVHKGGVARLRRGAAKRSSRGPSSWAASSVSDYVDADGVRGFFQLEHRVYGRARQACRDVRNGDQEDRRRRPGDPLLPNLPKIAAQRPSALLRDPRALLAARNQFSLRNRQQLPSRQEAQSLASSVCIPKCQRDLPFGVTVPQRKSSQQLAVPDTGHVRVAALLNAPHNARRPQRGCIKSEIKRPCRTIVEGNALAQAVGIDRDGNPVQGKRP